MTHREPPTRRIGRCRLSLLMSWRGQTGTIQENSRKSVLIAFRRCDRSRGVSSVDGNVVHPHVEQQLHELPRARSLHLMQRSAGDSSGAAGRDRFPSTIVNSSVRCWRFPYVGLESCVISTSRNPFSLI